LSQAVIISVLMMQFHGLTIANKHIHLFKSWLYFDFSRYAATSTTHLTLWSLSHVTPVPKGYLYFAISFSLLVEVLNMKMNKKKINYE
jgi:predicted tellurium resistance membrane protein TerC